MLLTTWPLVTWGMGDAAGALRKWAASDVIRVSHAISCYGKSHVKYSRNALREPPRHWDTRCEIFRSESDTKTHQTVAQPINREQPKMLLTWNILNHQHHFMCTSWEKSRTWDTLFTSTLNFISTFFVMLWVTLYPLIWCSVSKPGYISP